MITVKLVTEAGTIIDEYTIPEENKIALKAIQNVIELSRLSDTVSLKGDSQS